MNIESPETIRPVLMARINMIPITRFFVLDFMSVIYQVQIFFSTLFKGPLLIRRPMNLLELHQIAQGILKKDFSSDFFVQVRSPWFEIESEPTDWTLDGEFGGNLEYVKIQTYPNKLKLIRPPLQKESEKNPTFTQNDEMKSL